VVPPVRVEDGRVVLPLTFPDGTTAALASPRDLAIAELGVLVGGSGRLDGCRACAFDDATLGGGYGWARFALPEVLGSRPRSRSATCGRAARGPCG
jgi:hypothetical protein